MENIYKIKIRSDLSPQDLYPSERRYSASIVLGMSVLFLALALTSSLMGTLVVRKISTNTTITSNPINNNETFFLNISTNISDDPNRLLNMVEKELDFQGQNEHNLNIPALVSAGCFVMALGHTLAGLAGLLAWKCWYIDHNITWFFLTSSFSILTSTISLLLVFITFFQYETDRLNLILSHQISLGLVANIFITSILGVIWSFLASRVAYKGMKNDYPEDMVLSKSCKGRVEVNTVKKGNKIAKVVAPDILDHFPKTGKLAKYFSNKEQNRGGLPKAESNREYEERVKKFLTEGHRTQETETDN